jgi:transcriptional regulator with XRE-family HTH domain
MTVGERLRKARKKLGKTQTKVASECDVTQPTVHAWESDQCLPEAGRVRQVAKSYDVDPLDLLPRTKKPAA